MQHPSPNSGAGGPETHGSQISIEDWDADLSPCKTSRPLISCRQKQLYLLVTSRPSIWQLSFCILVSLSLRGPMKWRTLSSPNNELLGRLKSWGKDAVPLRRTTFEPIIGKRSLVECRLASRHTPKSWKVHWAQSLWNRIGSSVPGCVWVRDGKGFPGLLRNSRDRLNKATRNFQGSANCGLQAVVRDCWLDRG